MKPLEAKEFHRVVPIIENSTMKGHGAMWYSVLEGRQKGAVFVDDRANPQTVLVCGQQTGGYYVFGKADCEVFRAFVPELLSEHVTEYPCALLPTSEAWRETLDGLFTTRGSRIAFDFRPPRGWPPSDWQERIPPGFVLQRIDAALAERVEPMMGHPWPWFDQYWGSLENFLAHGFGFCLVREEEVASSCMTVAVGGGEAVIQINTARHLLRRGLATLVATAFIEHCLAEGLKPGWETSPNNRGSMILAIKVGFVPVGEFFGYPLDRSYQRLPDGRWGPASE